MIQKSTNIIEFYTWMKAYTKTTIVKYKYHRWTKYAEL